MDAIVDTKKFFEIIIKQKVSFAGEIGHYSSHEVNVCITKHRPGPNQWDHLRNEAKCLYFSQLIVTN